MKKSIIAICLLTLVLVGCGGSNKVEALYADLDAEETYEKMMEHLNENATYLKIVNDSGDSETGLHGEEERLLNDGVLITISEEFNFNESVNSFFIQSEEAIHYLYGYGDNYDYLNIEFDNSDYNEIFEDVLDREDIIIIDSERTDSENNITLTFHVKSTLLSSDAFYIYNFEIGKDGYLHTWKRIVSDEAFEREGFTRTYEIIDMNKKSSIDIDDAVERIEKLADELT